MNEQLSKTLFHREIQTDTKEHVLYDSIYIVQKHKAKVW